MTLSAAEWFRRTLASGDGWWRLSANDFRLAIVLVGAASVVDGKPQLVTTMDQIARYTRTSLGQVKRSMAALEAAGFCCVWGQRGRSGYSIVVFNDLDAFGCNGRVDADEHSQVHVSADISNETGPPLANFPGARATIYADHLQDVVNTGDHDLDLLRSPRISDLESGDLEENLKTEREESALSGTAIWLQAPAEAVDRKQAKPVEIPDRAFAAADYLRSVVLADHPSAVAGRVAWDLKAKAGRRLEWAADFRRLQRVVLAAIQNERPAANDGDAWQEIAKTVHWLFHNQPSPRFVVESPNSLRVKWDRIQLRRRQHKLEASQPKPARGADGRPDLQANRVFKKLG